MIIEHAWLPVTPGREQEFITSISTALAIIEEAPGCGGAAVRQQIENPSTFLLIVHWTDVDAHMAFRASDLFDEWRSRTHHFYESTATVTHFTEEVGRPRE